MDTTAGVEILERTRFEAEHCSEKSWKALSAQEQTEYREEFHDLCAKGIGENCRFYTFLMGQCLRTMIDQDRGRCRAGRSEIVSKTEMHQARPALER
jgi:hypothetical protein